VAKGRESKVKNETVSRSQKEIKDVWDEGVDQSSQRRVQVD